MNRPRVGWIGLGIMGRPMATNLHRAGFEVAAYNRGAGRREAFARDGGTVCASPKEVASASDVVVTMVSDTADVEAVVFGRGGVIEGARAGRTVTVIDMSTISPRATREMAARLRERGVSLVQELFSALAAEGGDEDGTQALLRTIERLAGRQT